MYYFLALTYNYKSMFLAVLIQRNPTHHNFKPVLMSRYTAVTHIFFLNSAETVEVKRVSEHLR